jgi:hypothetical protein
MATVQISVLLRERMPMLAMRLGGYRRWPRFNPPSTLAMHIPHVVERCTQEQMLWVTAGANIAPMKNEQPLRYRAVNLLPHQSMHELIRAYATSPHLSVAGGV